MYFENQGQGNPNTRYYVNSKKKDYIPIKFVHTNNTDLWVEIIYRENSWFTNQQGIINAPSILGWWIESDPQHPDHVNPEHFSLTLHTAIKQQEEILAGGVHHIATLQGTHSFEEQEPILPQIEAAIKQGITIPLDTTPAAATQPQLSIRTTMAEQQGEEINTTTGRAGQEAQRINVITNPAHGTLKGNPPFIFDGDRSTT